MKLRIIFSVALCFISVLCFSQILMQDNFDNNILSSNWTKEGTGVNIDNGIMKLTQDVTDRPTNLFSKWITFNATKPIIISRRVNVKNAGDYFYANMTLHFNNNTKGNSISIQYLYTKYYDNAYKSLKQGTQINYNSTTFNEKIIGSNIFGDWFTEKIIYYPTDGNVYYYRNDELIGNVKTDITHKGNNTIRLSFSPYGWYTKHYHYFDDILITQNGKIPQNNSQNIVSNSKTNVPKSNVKSSNQLSKEAKDVYNISKSKQFDKFNTTEVVYNKITYQVKLVKQPGIDIIIINKYKEGIGFTNSCIFNKSNLKPIFDFGKYLVLGRIFKVSNENHYYIPISSINPISGDVKKRSGLYDLTYNEEVFKPNEFYSIDYPYLLDHEANELAPDYYVLELPLNTLQLSPGDIYDNYYLYNIKDKSIIGNRSSDVKKNNYKSNSSSNTSSNYEIIEQNNISEIKVLDENANESSSISISIGCNNYKHILDKENEGFNIVYTSNSKSFSSNKDLSYLNNEIDNKIIYGEGGIATISFIADNGKKSFLKIKFNRGGSYRLEIYGKKY